MPEEEERIKKLLRGEFKNEERSNKKLLFILFALIAIGIVSVAILVTNLLAV